MVDFTRLIQETNMAEESALQTAPQESPAKADERKVESLAARRQRTADEAAQEDAGPPTRKRVAKPSGQFDSNRADPWTNFTTRLRKGTKDRLHRLCLERQLANEHPWVQQELIEEAVVALINKYRTK